MTEMEIEPAVQFLPSIGGPTRGRLSPETINCGFQERDKCRDYQAAYPYELNRFGESLTMYDQRADHQLRRK